MKIIEVSISSLPLYIKTHCCVKMGNLVTCKLPKLGYFDY